MPAAKGGVKQLSDLVETSWTGHATASFMDDVTTDETVTTGGTTTSPETLTVTTPTVGVASIIGTRVLTGYRHSHRQLSQRIRNYQSLCFRSTIGQGIAKLTT